MKKTLMVIAALSAFGCGGGGGGDESDEITMSNAGVLVLAQNSVFSVNESTDTDLEVTGSGNTVRESNI